MHKNIVVSRTGYCVLRFAISLAIVSDMSEFQNVEAARFQDNRHMKVVRLLALRTGRLYHLGDILGTHFY